MIGPPEDVIGECNARLMLGDDFGDGTCTCRCSLPIGHTGKHQEMSREMCVPPNGRNVSIQWDGDDRIEEVWMQWLNDQWEALGKPDGFDFRQPIPDNWDWWTVRQAREMSRPKVPASNVLRRQGGRQRKDEMTVTAEIRHVLATGAPWREHRTAYRRWHEWTADGTLNSRLEAQSKP